jgi:N-acetylglucosamine-6-sulfatase
VIDQGVPQYVAPSASGYATDYLADEALSFLRSAPTDQPWFLLFSPPAPHAPWEPAPGDRGAFAGAPVPSTALRVLNDVRGKPAWVRNLPPVSVLQRARFRSQQRRARETLLAVDRAIEAMTTQVQERGELDRTIIVFLTDNGYSFGEHRWAGKRCPYDPCVRTPMVIRSPWTTRSTVDDLVINVDLAPTLLDFVGSSRPVDDPPLDGVSLRPYLDRRSSDPPTNREGVLLQYAGDAQVPSWRSVRTMDLAYIETADGTRELYDLDGTIGRPDLDELQNRVDDVRYAGLAQDLAALLDSLVHASPRR